MVNYDVAPVTVRGPLATTGSKLVTFARLIVRDGRMFVAEGSRRGAIVTSVTEYPLPEGEIVPNPRKSKAGSLGPWSWDGCGCGNSWGKHTADSLIARAVPSPGLAAMRDADEKVTEAVESDTPETVEA